MVAKGYDLLFSEHNIWLNEILLQEYIPKMTSSNILPENSNTLMQTLHSIKSMIAASVTENEIPTELEKEESYIPVRAPVVKV